MSDTPTTTTPTAADDAATRAALDAEAMYDAWSEWEEQHDCDTCPGSGGFDSCFSNAAFEAGAAWAARQLAPALEVARRALALPLAECEAWAAAVRVTEQAKEAHVAVMRERLALPRSQWDSIWNREAEALGRIRLAEHFDEKRAHDALRAAVVATDGEEEVPHA